MQCGLKRSYSCGLDRAFYGALRIAGVAQLVERNLAKVEVESSRLFSRSNFKKEASASFCFGGMIWPGGQAVGELTACRHRDRDRDRDRDRRRHRRDSKAVMQRIANPSSPVRLRVAPPRQSTRAPFRGALVLCGIVLLQPRPPIMRAGPDGEIGRRSGLKIRGPVKGCTGSTPVPGTRPSRFRLPLSTRRDRNRTTVLFHSPAQAGLGLPA